MLTTIVVHGCYWHSVSTLLSWEGTFHARGDLASWGHHCITTAPYLSTSQDFTATYKTWTHTSIMTPVAERDCRRAGMQRMWLSTVVHGCLNVWRAKVICRLHEVRSWLSGTWYRSKAVVAVLKRLSQWSQSSRGLVGHHLPADRESNTVSHPFYHTYLPSSNPMTFVCNLVNNILMCISEEISRKQQLHTYR